ncbi:MAG: GntR family transcriptional regulator [Anaerolineae bacterium]|nr:GntR family transcriptional regulator [Anaerolineae bacterium]
MEQALSQRKPLKRQNLASMLVDDLRKRLLCGEFSGGTLLRQEQLAQEYGVSRMPVREALRQLDSEGLVIMQTNRGATVSELSLAEIDEIFDLREVLELDLLERAIPNMTPESLDKSRRILDELDEAYTTHDIAQWGALNGKFHMSMYEPAGRSISLSLVNRISLQVDRYLRLQISMTEAMTDGAVEHKAMLDLCAQGKTAEALELLATHIRRTKAQLIGILSARHGG